MYNTTLHHVTQKQESRGGCLGIILYIRGDQHSFAGEGVGEPDSDERTDTMVLYVNDKNSKRKKQLRIQSDPQLFVLADREPNSGSRMHPESAKANIYRSDRIRI